MPASARQDGPNHPFVFDALGWSGELELQWARQMSASDDPGYASTTHEVQALSAGGMLQPTGVVAWNAVYTSTFTYETEMPCSIGSPIPLTFTRHRKRVVITRGSLDLGTVGRAHVSNKGDGQYEVAFTLPNILTTVTETNSSEDCPTYQGGTTTRLSSELPGTFTAVVRPQGADIPVLQGSQAFSPDDVIWDVDWTVRANLTGCGEEARGGWSRHFPSDNRIEALEQPFRTGVARFVAALRKAGAKVSISNVFRPPERAYLMHYAWRVGHGCGTGRYAHLEPPAVPAYPGPGRVPICWMLRPDGDGTYDRADSISAARAMVSAYHIVVNHGAAFPSNHSGRTAIDMSISWGSQTLKIKNASGQLVVVNGTPRTGMNKKLWAVGKSYGVLKYVNAASPDPPHWSSNGR